MLPWNENRNEGTFGCSPGTKTGTKVRLDVPPERKPEQGYVHMFPRNENRNEGTFACSPGTKPERGYIRQNHPFTKPPFLANPGTTPITILAVNSDHGLSFAGEETWTMV